MHGTVYITVYIDRGDRDRERKKEERREKIECVCV
jgi:hypothetical protein